MKHVLLSVFTVLFSVNAVAQTGKLKTDSTYKLKEVTVSVARVINKVDRKLILPTATQVANSTNGYDLLQRLALPGLRINTAERTVTSLHGGSVQLRINDILATTQDILALRPDEIIRVEDIDNPGVRYSDANLDYVINYVVRRRYAGYVGGISTMQAFNAGFNNSTAYFKYNYKKSEFSVNYDFNYRSYTHWRNNTESTYLLPNGDTRERDYIGYDTPMMYTANNIQVSYNLSEPDKYTFSARFQLIGFNSPRHGNNQLATETGQPDLYMNNKVTYLTYTPSLDLYYSLKMKHEQKVEVNVVGTHIDTNKDYLQKEYLFNTSPEESMQTSPINNYSYSTKGSSNSVIGEAIYTKTINRVALSAGTEYTYSHTDNKYTGSNSLNDVLDYNNFYAFAQVQGTFKPINYVLGLGVDNASTHQSGAGYSKWTFRPELTLSTNVAKNVSLKYTSKLSQHLPQLSQLSNVRQQSNDLEANDGNPNLKPAYNYINKLSVDWSTKPLTLEVTGNLAYMPDAIMNSIIPEQQADGSYLLITKPMNQKSTTVAWVGSNATFHIIKDVLNVSLNGEYDHYRMHGLDYLHDYNAWQGGASADLTLGKWNVNYNFATASKYLNDETIFGGENSSDLTVQYRYKNFKFGLGCLLLGYAQGYDYTMNTDSKYYKSKSNTWIKENGNMIYFTVSYDFSHGRKYTTGDRSLYNNYNDSGVK